MTQRSWKVARLLVPRIRMLGARWIREEFTATRLHSGPRAPYTWTTFDRVVNLERRSGLRILGLLDYSNTWRFGDHGTMPHASIRLLSTDFARYAYAVARHFRGRIFYWQIWNEPDRVVYWHPGPNPADYATLLSAAFKAIKRADQRDKVVMAGTSGVDLTFVRAVAAKTHNYDIVSVHPYRSEPETDLIRQVSWLRRLHRPIWFTEIGWAAGVGCDSCTGEDVQASYLLRFYALSAAAGVQRVFWYDLRDDAHMPGDPEAHFGLLQYDLSGKPAFAAYAFMADLLVGSRFMRADAAGEGGVYALRFNTAHGPAVVAWATGGGEASVGVRWPSETAVELDAFGDPITNIGVRGHWTVVTLPADGAPVYLLSAASLPPQVPPGALLHYRPPATPIPHVYRGSVRKLHVARRPAAHRRAVAGNRAAWAITRPTQRPPIKAPAPSRRELVLPTATPTTLPTATATSATPQSTT